VTNSSDEKGAEAAEWALKAYALQSDPRLLAEVSDGNEKIGEMAAMVNLTEAPEDAVCSLVIDLWNYCEREKIDWAEDVIARANERRQAQLRPRASRPRI
jgi:hypothetical protein